MAGHAALWYGNNTSLHDSLMSIPPAIFLSGYQYMISLGLLSFDQVLCFLQLCISTLIREHYYKKLLKRTLQQWEDIWWNGRNEWKLNIRADYHNRYVDNQVS